MVYRALIPPEATEAIPAGAALLEDQRTEGIVALKAEEPFAEQCARAAREGRRVRLPQGCVEVGYYDAIDGELRLHEHRIAFVSAWLGRGVCRDDLQARENRSERRRRARSLLLQGRFLEAARIDRRMGL